MSCIASTSRPIPIASRTSHNGPLEIAWTVIPALDSCRDRGALVSPAGGAAHHSGARHDAEGDGLAVALELRLSENRRRLFVQFPHQGGQGPEARGHPPSVRRQRRLCARSAKWSRVDVVSQDVIHSFSMPSFGVKIDAVPGRLNKTWFKADQEGVFYGQCSNICGIDHAFMPIEIHVLSQDAYQAWLEGAKKQFARADGVDLAQTTLRQTLTALKRRPRESSFGADSMTSVSDFTHAEAHAHDEHGQSTAIRPGGADTCTRPITRTSARSIWSSRSAPALLGMLLSIAIRAELMFPGSPGLSDDLGDPDRRRFGRRRQEHVQRVLYQPRAHHDLLHGDAGDDGRLRQLDGAAFDRRARHGVPADEQPVVLDAGGLVRAC